MKNCIYRYLLLIMLFFIIPCKHSFSQEYTMPSFVHAIDACDMDRDGNMDIIASCGYEDSLVILYNDGIGILICIIMEEQQVLPYADV